METQLGQSGAWLCESCRRYDFGKGSVDGRWVYIEMDNAGTYRMTWWKRDGGSVLIDRSDNIAKSSGKHIPPRSFRYACGFFNIDLAD